MRSCLSVVAVAAILTGGAQAAETAPPAVTMITQPKALPSLGATKGMLAAGATDCFALDTQPGQDLKVSVTGAGFVAQVVLARGALCSANAPQVQGVAKGPGAPAALTFNAPGGRYLILIRASGEGAGRYELNVQTSRPAVQASGVGGGDAAPGAVDARVALMNAQVAQRQLQIAQQEQARVEAEEARRAEIARQRAEEQRRKDERFEAFASFVGAATMALSEASQEYTANMAAQSAAVAEQQRNVAEAMARQQEAQRAASEANARAAAQAEQAKVAALAQQRASLVNDFNQAKAQGDVGGQRRALTNLQFNNQAALSAGLQDKVSSATEQRLGPQPSSNPQAAQAQRQAEAARAEAARVEADRQRQAEQQRVAEQQRQAQEAQRQAELRRQAELQKQAEAQRLQAQRQARMMANSSGGFSASGLAGLPTTGSGSPGSGRLSRGIDHVGGCQASSFSVGWRLSTYMGGGSVGGTWRWTGEQGCSPPAYATVWLKVQSGSAYGWVPITPSPPLAGQDSLDIAGILDWDDMFCGFRGASRSGCMSADDAKRLWLNGNVVDAALGW